MKPKGDGEGENRVMLQGNVVLKSVKIRENFNFFQQNCRFSHITTVYK